MRVDHRARVFISHTSADKDFARDLARRLQHFGHPVWFDEWEVAVGDSIVDKVFAGLRASDTLIVVLSPSSVESRWVKEELSVGVMRRITENDVRILPVLIETCEIPEALKHIRYADFRTDHHEALSELLESLVPGHALWTSLSHHFDHFCLLVDQFQRRNVLDAGAADDLTQIHDLLNTALNLRTDVELRRARQRDRDLNFFEKIDFLVAQGVDVRSQTWNALVEFRARLAHDMKSSQAHLECFAYLLKNRHDTGDLREGVVKGLDRLTDIMRLICFEAWEPNALARTLGLSS